MMSHADGDDLKVYVQKAPQGHVSHFNNMLFTHTHRPDGMVRYEVKEV